MSFNYIYVMDVELLPHQMEFIASESRVVMMTAGRGAGKSVVGGWVGASQLNDGRSGMILGPTFTSIRVMRDNLIESLTMSGVKPEHHKTEHWIEHPGTKARAYYCTAESEKDIRGKTNLHWLMSEETQDMDERPYNVAFACCRGVDVRNPRRFIFCTARDKSHWLYKTVINPSTHYISVDTSHNTFLDKSFSADLKAQYNDVLYRQEVLAEWTDESAGGFVEARHWLAFTEHRQRNGSDVCLALDVAAGGDDSVASVSIGGEVVAIVGAKTNSDIESLIMLCRRALGGLSPARIAIDATGMGMFVPSAISRVWPGAKISVVNFAAEANNPNYSNRRTEIHYLLRTSVEDGKLWLSPAIKSEDREMLQREMLGVLVTIDRNRKLALESKDGVKKRIGRSTDRLDSICLLASIQNLLYLPKSYTSAPLNFPVRQ